MASLILVANAFDAVWPFAADHAAARLGDTASLQRLPPGDPRPAAAAAGASAATCTQLWCLGVRLTAACLAAFPRLAQVAATDPADLPLEALASRGIALAVPRHEGFWGQSVAEFALGLTIAALRRIPQTSAALRHDPAVWDYQPAVGRPGQRGQQFGDDPRFVHGTIAGKRIAVIGMGNIGARYAHWCALLGASLIGYDPVAPEPVFHRTGTRRVWSITEALAQADIVAPMLPLRPGTERIVDAAAIERIPRGSLVVLVTRTGILAMSVLRRRVLQGELSLAADVHEVEPIPAEDALLHCAHAVLTPHNAGRTVHANQALIDHLVEQFPERPSLVAGSVPAAGASHGAGRS